MYFTILTWNKRWRIPKGQSRETGTQYEYTSVSNDYSIEFWNCSDSVVFIFIVYHFERDTKSFVFKYKIN